MSPTNPQRKEILLQAHVVDADNFGIAVSVDGASFENTVPRQLPASIREDLRLLRWKAAGIHNPGDALLIDVGHRLSGLALPPERRSEWDRLFQANPSHLRVKFSAQTEELLHLPWELFRINDRFVLQDPGSHVIREVHTLGAAHRKPWEFRMLHVSFGVDPALRLDEERCALLDAIPENTSLTFLLNPTMDELGEVLARLRPTVVVVSGHGRYDDMTDAHAIESLEGALETDSLIRLAGRSGCGLLLLWTCESAFRLRN